MLDFVRRTLARPWLDLWLALSPHSWKRRSLPRDSPHVRAPGTSSDRVLVTGDGAASGRGVSTHELGLPGFLARSLSARTNRATEVDIAVDDDMTVMTCMTALVARDLDSYDIVVLSSGANEALSLLSPNEWLLEMRALITSVRLKAPRATRIFVLAIPQFGANPHFPRRLGDLVDFHVGVLNTITERLVEEHEGVFFVPESRDQAFEDAGVGAYEKWAELIAERIVQHLDPRRPARVDRVDEYELARQHAFQRLEATRPENDPVLDELAEEARKRLRADMAAVTFIGDETEHVWAATGGLAGLYERSDALCDLTIRRPGEHVIEDLPRDYRFRGYGVVAGELGARFYAGHPIESPDGFRVGALCVLDSKTRRLSEADSVVLRDLATQVQRHVYGRTDVAV